MHRAVLGIVAAVVPLMGFMAWATPLTFDPMSARLVLSGLALGSLAATYLHELPRRHSRELVMLTGCLVTAWFAYVASRHDISPDDVVGLLPCACVMPMTVARRSELVASVVFIAATTALAAYFADAPEFPPATFSLLFVVLTLGLGLSSLSRARAEQRLHSLASQLDARVDERTAELRQALKRAEHEAEERRRAEHEAVQASQAKSRFLANMSHELRTPLNAVIGYTEMVSEELEDLEGGEDLAPDLGKATTAAQHLLTLIDDVLDLSRIEADEFEVDMRPVTVAEVVDHAIAHTPQLAPTPTRGLRVAVPPVQVRADQQRLTQVLINLLANAAKFTDQGEVAVEASQEGDRVRLSVRDTGQGIPLDLLPHVFDRFTQADSSTTRRHGGTGLGLAISRKLVERMDGRIEVASEPGQGSTFTVWLLAA